MIPRLLPKSRKKQITFWLSEDSLKCIEQSPYQMKMVIRGIKRSLKDPDPKTVREKVFDLLESWLLRVFSGHLNAKNVAEIRSSMEGSRSPLCRKIESMTDAVLSEANKAVVQ